jgi:hypothetical protein
MARRATRELTAAVAVFTALAAAGPARPATAQPVGGSIPTTIATSGATPQVSVSATTVIRGDTLTVRGTGCLVDGEPGAVDVLDVFLGADQLRRTRTTAGPDGSWSAQVDVPLDAELGSSPVGAHCLASADGPDIAVFYRPVTVTVIPARPPRQFPDDSGPPPVTATPSYTG